MDGYEVGDVLYPEKTDDFPLLWVTEVASGAFRGFFVKPNGGYCAYSSMPGPWHKVGHVDNPPTDPDAEFNDVPKERLVEFILPLQTARSLGYEAKASWV